MKKKKVTLWVLACYVYFSRSLHGQTVWVSCGMSESVVMSEQLSETEWM